MAANAACSVATTWAPSPTAAATRFTEPDRTSPIAKMPHRLVSNGPLRRDPESICGSRQMGPSSPAGGAAQALEARPGRLSRACRPRDVQPRRRAGGCQYPPLVAQLIHGTPHRATEYALQPAGSPQTCQITSTHRTARCGPACRVVWQGTRRYHLRAPMPIDVHPSLTSALSQSADIPLALKRCCISRKRSPSVCTTAI